MQEPFLNKETDLVHCAECDGVIENVSIFAKREMRFSGQIKRAEKRPQAFAVKCASCEKSMCPELVEEPGKKRTLVCGSCGEEHTTIPAPYAQTVIAFLKKAL